MRRAAPWLLLAAVAAPPALALGFGERKLTAELVDADSGQPVAGASFLVREINNLREPPIKLHGSGPTESCLRGTVISSSTTITTYLKLEATSVEPHEKLLSKGTSLAVYAYAPGYCVGEIKEGYRPALSIEGNVTSSFDKRSSRATLRTRRDTSHPEQRMRYLHGVLSQLYVCGDSPELAALQADIQAEIQALERSLALPREGRGFVIRPESSTQFPDWKGINMACGPGDTCSSIGAATAYREGATPPAPHPLMLVCNGETGCDLDRRYAGGKTALYTYLHAADAERSILLVKAGADPDIALYPGGPTGVDKLLEGPFDGARGPATLEILEALLQDGRATVSPRTAARLAKPWGPGTERIRAAAMSLPVRQPAPASVCRPIPYRTDIPLANEEY